MIRMVTDAESKQCELCGKPILRTGRRYCSRACSELAMSHGPVTEAEVWQRAESIQRSWTKEERRRRQVGWREWQVPVCKVMVGDELNDDR